MTEANQIQQSIGTALRKSKGRQASGLQMTAASLRNPDTVTRLLHDDEAYKIFSSVRGSPSAWQKMQYDCLAKIRHLGTYTWFFTFSVADTMWPEIIQVVARQYGVHFSDDQVAGMSWPTKCQWLRRNPVTAARHADYMFQQLLGKVILAPPHPIGVLVNYDIKKEAQHRGPMHFHAAAHVQGAPRMDTHTDEEIIQFIDNHVKCTLPSEEEDKELATLVQNLQTHHHTASCKKSGQACRYNFPKPVSPYTILAKPPSGEDPAQEKKEADKILKDVYETMIDWNLAEPITLSGLLSEAGVSEDKYTAALKISTNRCTVILKRGTEETSINNYNPSLLKIWRANMDLQYVFNAFACIKYVTSYLCKAEKTMSQLLCAASRESNDNDVRKRLNKLGNVFLTHRELTSHEAVCRILSMPLRQSNRSVIFIPSGFPSERTRLLKPKDQLEQLEDGSTSIFMTNLIDRYAARPEHLHELCYAEFAATYTVRYEKPSNEEGDSVDMQQEPETRSDDALITLSNNLGTMRRRQKEAIIRYHMPSEDKNPEEYYYSSLLLFYPWESEDTDLTMKDDSYYGKYKQEEEIIQMNKQKFEKNTEEIDAAFQDLEAGNDVEGGWDQIAAQVEQERREDAQNICHFDVPEDPDDSTVQQVDIPVSSGNQSHLTTSTVHFSTNVMPTADYYALVRSLNTKQKMLHDFVRDWCCKRRFACHPEELPEPFYIFLSGSGGVGKSHTVNAVYQAVYQTLRREGQDPDQPLAMLTASTGCASFNIGGVTIHSALNLSIKERGRVNSNKLSSEKLHSLRHAFQNLAVIIIDEISMIGEDTFLQIHRRLQEIMGIPDTDQTTVFGGISILAVGDLMQLPPVAESPIFQTKSKNKMSRLYGSLFVRHFKLIELTELHRQRNDPLFGDILNRIRLGETQEEDMNVLRSRLVSQDDPEYPREALHVFATNKVVHQHNNNMLQTLSDPLVTIECKDTLSTKFGQTCPQLPESIHATGGLHTTLTVGTGAKVSLTKNVDTSDGLVNGARGTTAYMSLVNGDLLNGTIYVSFDNHIVGKKLAQSVNSTSLVPYGSIPITAVVSRFSFGNFVINRLQYPITLAWAATIHKVQGQTLDKIIVSFSSGRFNAGQAYVALSRTRTISGLHLLDFNPGKIRANKASKNEMERLRNDMPFSWVHPLFEIQDGLFSVGHLNIRSLQAHAYDLVKSSILNAMNILTLSEAYCRNLTSLPPMEGYDLHYYDSQHGLACVVPQGPSVQMLHSSTVGLEAFSMAVAFNTAKIMVLTVYKPPRCDLTLFLTQLDSFMTQLPVFDMPVIVLGDFNVNLLTENQNSEKLLSFMAERGFSQKVTGPTHSDGGLLDHIYVNSRVHVQSVTSADCYFSDHALVCIKCATL